MVIYKKYKKSIGWLIDLIELGKWEDIEEGALFAIFQDLFGSKFITTTKATSVEAL